MTDSADSLPELKYGELTGWIRQTAFDIHQYFGSGFLEKVYEGALENRLARKGHFVSQQVPLKVADEDGTVVGHYTADLVVDNRVLLEVKAAGSLTSEHQAQLLNYLKATGMRVGMLINFGNRRLQVKRFTL